MWTTCVTCLCVCVCFEHVLVFISSIENVDAAQGRNVPCSAHCNEYVVLSPAVVPLVASTLFFFAGG